MQQFVVANWKMYLKHKDAKHLAKGIVKNMLESTDTLPKVVICPSHPHLISVYDHIKGASISLGAQGCLPKRLGANTGEVSIDQLKDINTEYIIVGHSEQRKEHSESTSEDVRHTAESIIERGLIPILCIGETLEERRQGAAVQKITHQLANELPRQFQPGQLLIAYEPLWSIGTDQTPTKREIEEMHQAIQYELEQIMPNGNLVPILYGGSVTPKNAEQILRCKGVHGVLVGRHGVKLDDLWAIINAHTSHEEEEDQ